jgi:hypothetical protein
VRREEEGRGGRGENEEGEERGGEGRGGKRERREEGRGKRERREEGEEGIGRGGKRERAEKKGEEHTLLEQASLRDNEGWSKSTTNLLTKLFRNDPWHEKITWREDKEEICNKTFSLVT